MRRKLCIAFASLLAFMSLGLANEAKASTTPHEVKDIIVKTAVSMGVDPCVALSIAKHESEFQAHKKSSYGAVGVFQLMPSTAKRIGVNPYVVNENIKGGIMYYQMMYKKFGSMDLALAAYNAGPGNVAKYNGIPPFRETKNFVSGIKNNYKTFQNDPAVLKHTTKQQEVKKPENKAAAAKPENDNKQVQNNVSNTPVKEVISEAKKDNADKITAPDKTTEKVLADSSLTDEIQKDEKKHKIKNAGVEEKTDEVNQDTTL